MSKADPRDNRTVNKSQTESQSAPVFKAPLQPRRGLCYTLLGVLALWSVAVVMVYVRTVYPTRHQHAVPLTEPAESTVAR
jgi:hypothetical protein